MENYGWDIASATSQLGELFRRESFGWAKNHVSSVMDYHAFSPESSRRLNRASCRESRKQNSTPKPKIGT
jgi:hypothetical protein